MIARERELDGFGERETPRRRRFGRLGKSGACTGAQEQRDRRSSERHDWLSRRRCQRTRVERREVAEIQGKSSQCRDEYQRCDRCPGDEMKRVDERQRVGLQTNVAGHQSNRAAGSARGAVRTGRQSGRQEPQRVVGDPVAGLDVKAEEIRVQLSPAPR